ncbi:MAG: hypothetical protein L3J59_01280 [Methylococcaceae bacterium]|nr:hypothetical protein [Methylococcaceae bacterium]
MKKINKTPLAIAVGGTLLSSLASTAVLAGSNSSVDENPFEISELSSGYMLTAKSDSDEKGSKKMKDGSCGEGKCGSSMMKGSEEKTAEGKCAGDKPMPSMKKSGKKDTEGKCGSM